MKLFYKVLVALFFMFVQPNFLSAQFSSAFAPVNWGTVAVNSEGIVNVTGSPASIFMLVGNNNSGTPGIKEQEHLINEFASGVFFIAGEQNKRKINEKILIIK